MKESLFQFAYYPIFLAINTIKNELKKEKIKNCLYTSRRRKTLNPVFNESFKFEVPF